MTGPALHLPERRPSVDNLMKGTVVSLSLLGRVPLQITRALAATLIAVLVVVVGGSVILRAVGVVPSGSTELATLLFTWAIYIGAFLALIEGEHLAVTVATDRLKGRAFIGALILADLLVLVFAAVVASEGYNYIQLALDSIRVTPSLGISPAWQYSAVAVGMALACLHLLVSIGRNIVRIIRNEPPPAVRREEDIVDEAGS